MIFRAWAIRSGPKRTAVRTTRQTVNVGMTSSLFGSGWRRYSLRSLSRSGRYCPVQNKNPARPNHTDFRACDYNIEQLHREGQQVTGLERCQCRKARIQRNHIGCAFLVWVRLKEREDTVGQPPRTEIGVPNMPSLKAKKLRKLPREKVLLEL
jgi:hypothetical protein